MRSIIMPYLLATQPDVRIYFYEEIMSLLEAFQFGKPVDQLTSLMTVYEDDYPSEFNDYLDAILLEALYDIIAGHGIILNHHADMSLQNLYKICYALWTVTNAPMCQEIIDEIDNLEIKKEALCNILVLHSNLDLLQIASYIIDVSDGFFDRTYSHAKATLNVELSSITPLLVFNDDQVTEKIKILKSLKTQNPHPAVVIELIESKQFKIGTALAPYLNIFREKVVERVRHSPKEAAVNLYAFIVATNTSKTLYVSLTKELLNRYFKDPNWVAQACSYVDQIILEGQGNG